MDFNRSKLTPNSALSDLIDILGDELESRIQKSQITGLLKNDGSVDTESYILDILTPSGTSTVSNKIATLPNIYVHNIAINGDNTTRIYTILVTAFNTAFDVDSFIAYINNLSSPAGIMCTGTVRTSSSGIATGRTAARIVPGNASGNIGIAYHDTGDAGVTGPIYYSKGSGANQISSITDSVIPVFNR